jgi:hypothetical protein
MSVLRIHKKQQNYVILDKTCLNDNSLSWGAKGLHAYLMSLPDDWKVRVSDLQKRSKNGRDAVRKLLVELEGNGYIKKSPFRNEGNGRFGGMEYLVLEIPETKNEGNAPEPEKPSSVKTYPKNPATGNPSPVLPETEKATLMNNKYNNNLNNQGLNKTAANRINATVDTQTQQNSAAVIFSQSLQNEVNQPAKPLQEHQPINFLSQEDALISEKLTRAQKQRVSTIVESLDVSQKEVLSNEIEFCLLNPKHFTACGKDFSRKLNAIRGVILRGDWQTPTGMIHELSEVKNPGNLLVKRLENELREVHAEANHFKKLLSTAKEHTRAHFEAIISQAQSKIHDIEEQLRETLSQRKEALC